MKQLEDRYTGKYSTQILRFLSKKIESDENGMAFDSQETLASLFPNYKPENLRKAVSQMRKDLEAINQTLEPRYEITLTETKFSLRQISTLEQRSQDNSPRILRETLVQQGYPAANPEKVYKLPEEQFFVSYRYPKDPPLFDLFKEDLRNEVNQFKVLHLRPSAQSADLTTKGTKNTKC